MVGYVSVNEHPRNGKGREKMIWIRGMVALAALFAFLTIRNAPPHFPQQPSIHHTSVKAVFNAGHRPHFDSDRLQWSAPAKALLPFSLAAESLRLSPASQGLSVLQTKGFRYNRPPPVG